MVELGFPVLSKAIEDSAVSQARIAARLGYRADVFSKVLNGHQPPKGGLSPERFTALVLRVLNDEQGGGK